MGHKVGISQSGITLNHNSQRFEGNRAAEESQTTCPLSVIVQVTRRCDLSCVFCSETSRMSDPSLEQLKQIKQNLSGVRRVYISGGEPMLRNDLVEILDLYRDEFVIGLPTNATRHADITPALAERVNYVNTGLDGPRSTTTRIREDYDTILKGIWRFRELDVPISLSCVVLSSTVKAVPFVCQIADLLDARKLKMILPIPKGNALKLPEHEYLSTVQAETLFHRIVDMKSQFDWQTKLTMTAWTAEVEGYSVLVYPDGNTYAWPVYGNKDKVQLLGNLLHESIVNIWERNPFKENHLRKYLGQSIMVA